MERIPCVSGLVKRRTSGVPNLTQISKNNSIQSVALFEREML